MSLLQVANKAKMRYWILPLIVAVSITIGLSIGLWGLATAISNRTQALSQLNEQIEQTKASFKARGIEIDGDYLLLPKGMRTQTGFESEKQKREAIKMIRE